MSCKFFTPGAPWETAICLWKHPWDSELTNPTRAASPEPKQVVLKNCWQARPLGQLPHTPGTAMSCKFFTPGAPWETAVCGKHPGKNKKHAQGNDHAQRSKLVKPQGKSQRHNASPSVVPHAHTQANHDAAVRNMVQKKKKRKGSMHR